MKKEKLVSEIDSLISYLTYQKNVRIDKFNLKQQRQANELSKVIHRFERNFDIRHLVWYNLTPKERQRLRKKCSGKYEQELEFAIEICNNNAKLAYAFCMVRYRLKQGSTSIVGYEKIISCILECNYDIEKSVRLVLDKYY